MKEKVSYSLHISNSRSNSKSPTPLKAQKADSTIKNMKDLQRVNNHNLRKYKDEKLGDKDYDKSKIFILKGSDNLVQDVKDTYKELFEESRLEYNLTQKRSSKKISNYLEKMCEDKQKEIAVEIILQIGDMNFFKKYGYENKKEEFVKLYEKQLKKLEEILPNFKISNAVLHLDEASPHVQLVGVPFTTKNKRGMKVQVAKSQVFTRESLKLLQEKMREDIDIDFKKIYPNVDIEMKEKEEGRNRDFVVSEFIKIKKELDNQKALEKSRIDSELKDYKEKLLKDNKPTDEEIREYKNNILRKYTPSKEEIREYQNEKLREYKPTHSDIQFYKERCLEEHKPTDEEIREYKDKILSKVTPSSEEIETYRKKKLEQYDPSTEELQEIYAKRFKDIFDEDIESLDNKTKQIYYDYVENVRIENSMSYDDYLFNSCKDGMDVIIRENGYNLGRTNHAGVILKTLLEFVDIANETVKNKMLEVKGWLLERERGHDRYR